MAAATRRTKAAHIAALLIAVLTLLAWHARDASATQSAKLNVALVPEHLGRDTTIVLGFQIATPLGRIPPPLTAFDLRYPANLGIVTSGLGLATCEPATLEALGPEGCPPDSLIGHGSALAEIPLGPEIIHETGQITTWMAPIQEGHLRVLFYAEARSPIYAQLIFTGLVLEAPPPFGGSLDTNVPPVPTLPEAPDAAVVQMRATIGPKNVTYYERSHGKTIAYQPNGIRLPETCPRHGFPFAATFNFLDGTHTTINTSVPCPADKTA